MHVQQLETDEAVRRLRSGDADLAVVHHMPGAPVPETTGLVRHPLLVDRLHVLVPEGHRLARHDTIGIADLEGEPLILPRAGTPAARFRTVMEHLCAQAGFSPQAAYELDDPPSAQAFVAAGIAVVPMHGLMLAGLPPEPPAARSPTATRAAASWKRSHRQDRGERPSTTFSKCSRAPPAPPPWRDARVGDPALSSSAFTREHAFGHRDLLQR